MITRRRFLTAAGLSLTAGITRAAPAEDWLTLAPLPISTQELYPAVHKGRLWVAGGIARRLGVPFFADGVFSYDPSLDKWRAEAAMDESRHHAAMVSNGESLFVVGGFEGSVGAVWKMLDRIIVLRGGAWVEHGQMPMPQAEGVLTHQGNGIVHLATGQMRRGEANSARSDHIETEAHWRWDSGSNTWDAAAPVPTPRNSATGGWYGRELIVTGGRTAQGNLDVTEIYDADEDRWRTAAPMPLPQAGTASVIAGDSLIVFGGEIFQPRARVFPNVWRYRFNRDSWEPMPNMKTPRHGIGAGLIGKRAFVIGGATEPGGSGTTNVNEALVPG